MLATCIVAMPLDKREWVFTKHFLYSQESMWIRITDILTGINNYIAMLEIFKIG